MTDSSHRDLAPSAWVCRFASRIPPAGRVLDVACGGGRHALMLARMGHRVHAVDRDAAAIARLAGIAGVSALQADLESEAWPYEGASFEAVIVANYLHRPLLPRLVDAVAAGGVLIYETFASGNERFGRPSNPEFLLRPGELLELVRARLRVLAYEDLQVDEPRPALVQRICAERGPASVP
ncbi:MAG: class I SAM-dependent methyltransferase [Burkholderiales bacterium]|nr:class I SAM-dependent methyltransferase [Burkholderiales bacterium]